MIRSVTINDAEAITNIYNYYVVSHIATFVEEPVSVTYFKNKIEKITKNFPWFVFEENNRIVGYAHGNFWNTRSAYGKTAEVSIYLDVNVGGKGIGSQLYNNLIRVLIEKGFHVLIGGISLPNKASVALHEKFGFTKVAHFKEVGYKFNKWVDVGYWQLTVNNNNK